MSISEDNLAAALAALERFVHEESEQPKKAGGTRAALGTLKLTRTHAANALAHGQNADALLTLARRKVAEAITLLNMVTGTMPASDVNAATIKTIVTGLSD
jgi:hypothetical protein